MKHLLFYSTLCFLVLCTGGCSKSNSSSSRAQTPKQAVVTTFAGDGSGGFADGTGTAAKFYHPYGIIIDGSGTLYVSDENNYLMRKITAAGSVTTLAGSTAGYADGSGTAAKFFGPEGLTWDGNGNIIVADYVNNNIRRVTTSGAVTTIAGSTEGYVDGTGTTAKFFYPSSVVTDITGNLFIGDTYNQRIRKITPAGVVSTFAGGGPTGPGNGSFLNGTGTAARFQSPAGMVFDASGNMYMVDAGNNLIRKVTSAGVVTTYSGSGTIGHQDGSAQTAEFAAPAGLALDGAGDLFVADYGNNCIREITPDGNVTTIAGSPYSGKADGIGTAASFDGPTSLVFDASGNLFVADHDNNLIRKITFK